MTSSVASETHTGGDSGLRGSLGECWDTGYMPQPSEQGSRSSCHMLFWLLLPKISSIMYWARGGKVEVLHSQQSRAEPASSTDV